MLRRFSLACDGSSWDWQICASSSGLRSVYVACTAVPEDMRGEGMHLSLAVALSDSSWAIGKDNKSKVSSNSLVIMMGALFVCFRSLNVMCLI
jgi:hypothetical protein